MEFLIREWGFIFYFWGLGRCAVGAERRSSPWQYGGLEQPREHAPKPFAKSEALRNFAQDFHDLGSALFGAGDGDSNGVIGEELAMKLDVYAGDARIDGEAGFVGGVGLAGVKLDAEVIGVVVEGGGFEDIHEFYAARLLPE